MILRFRGFTLIELLIGVALFIFLIMLAGPYLGQFMANSQIRTGAEAMYNGVQQAQAAAIHGNAVARLLVDTTQGTGGWQVLQTVDGTESATPVQVYTVQDGAPKVTVTPIPADARQITFDAFGRVVPNVDASSTLTCIKVTHSMTGTRQLNVAISSNALNTGTKLCDPAVVSTEPQGCPAGCN